MSEVTQVEKFEILPSNLPSLGKYSFSQGNPIVQFNIGSVPKLLRTSSLRVNGTISVRQSDKSAVDNLGFKGGTATDIQMNSRVGVNAVFQNVNIASSESNQTLESVRQYPRLIASVLPSVNSEEDFMSHNGLTSKATAIQDVNDVMCNNDMSFSVQMFAGIFQSSSVISLGVNGVRGLSLSLELAPDSQVLKTATADTGATYELSNMSISGDMLVGDALMSKLSVSSSGQMVFNSFSSLYSVINSSDSTSTFNLSASNVLSVIHNFVPPTHINSYANDGCATDMLKNKDASGAYVTKVNLRKTSFSRGGLKLKYDYDFNSTDQSAQLLPETGVQIAALNALQPYTSLTKMLNQPLLFPYGTKDGVITSDTTGSILHPEPQVLTSTDPARNFCVGLAMDRLSGQGIDFRGTSYALRLQTDLDGNSPMSVYTYSLARNVLNWSPSGIFVSS